MRVNHILQYNHLVPGYFLLLTSHDSAICLYSEGRDTGVMCKRYLIVANLVVLSNQNHCYKASA